MGLRFVPRLLRRTREVAQAQKLARPAERGWLAGIRRAGRVVSIVVTWALENALDTADSMKSGGYGLPGSGQRFPCSALPCGTASASAYWPRWAGSFWPGA